MCGILGLVLTKGVNIKKDVFIHALSKLDHRGPDAKNIYIKNSLGLGNTRLAVIDPGERSDQPLEYKGRMISFNGAIYNYPEIRSELQELGHCFKTGSDTEVILASYLEWGEECVHRFNGMWAFIIYDPENNHLFCSRDRFGIKPLYYVINERGFYVASEIKAFTSFPFWSAKLEEETAYLFLKNGMQHYSEKTFFNGVFNLPPSCNLYYSISNHTLSKKKYYLAKLQQEPLSISTYVKQFGTLLKDSITLRLRADVKIGACLSGGLDSSTIVSFACEQQNKFDSFSVYYPDPCCDERPYINSVTVKTGVKNHLISPELDDLISSIDEIIYAHDAPIPSVSMFSQYKLFEKVAKCKNVVMLDGQGGDELLAGYDIFHLNFLKSLFRRNIVRFLFEGISFVVKHKTAHMRILRRYFSYKEKSRNRAFPWLKIYSSNPVPANKPGDLSLSNISQSLFDEQGLQALLHYEDRNSMAHSIESRLPFLDHRLVELCLSMPDKLKIHAGERKVVLRKCMKDILPEKVRTRMDKKGFEVPQQKWINKNYAYLQQEVLEEMNKNSLFDPASFPRNPSPALLWRVWVFTKWLKVFNVET